jgi:uncharacterized protein YegL
MKTRPLHFIWIVDCSGSMQGDKIQALNFAIREALPAMQDSADENPNAQVLVRAIKFGSGANWHVSQPTELKNFQWSDLTADGLTEMGAALRLAADALKVDRMGDRALPPVLVLISDGQPTDDFAGGLKALMDQPWGKKAVRVSIAIGEDADHESLQKFIGHNEIKPLLANNPGALVKYMKWVSTAVLKSASSPASQVKSATPSASNIPIPTPPAPAANAGPASANDVW